MDNVVIFKPRHELEYEKNTYEFIELCRRLPPLNSQYDYESAYWNGVGNFTKFGVSNQDRDPINQLDNSVMPFAKAYVVYGYGSKSSILMKFYAIRALTESCMQRHGKVDFTTLTSSDFDLAAQISREFLGAGAAYQAGLGLKKLLEFLIENKMMKSFVWKSPIKKPVDNPIGEKGDEIRQKKMPDERAIMALASISAAKTEDLSPRDIFTTSTMTLLMSAPSRGSEPFYLKADAIHQERMKITKALTIGMSEDDIKNLVALDSNPQIQQISEVTFDESGFINLRGLKWFSGKGYGYENKWLPTVMIEAVMIAIERLKTLSSDARNFAKLLESSTEFPRHKLCPNVPEDKLLTADEAAYALGLDLSIYDAPKRLAASRKAFLKRKGVSTDDYQVTLKDLNIIVRNSLPKGFPYIPFKKGMGHVKLKWSEALYAAYANTFTTQKPICYTELAIPTINTLNEDLAPTKKKSRTTGKEQKGTWSIFQRWNYGDLSMTSHQLRHMLDTIAAVNGMEGDLRAKWAQRSDPKHNRYYDHTTPEEYGADFLEERERQLAVTNEASNHQIQVQVATPRTIQELNTKASLTAHTTEFGICITSYLSEPCTKYRDCINCSEHVCVKGDDDKCDRIRERLKREEKLLKQDEKAVKDRIQGAQQWFERRQKTVERCRELIKMMDDPSIEDGALIKLSSVDDVSLLDRAMDANGKKRLPEIKNYKRLQKVSVSKLLEPKNTGIKQK